MIETFGLSKRYGDKVALDRVSLRVEAGEVMGFLGPNGSGKTTTIRLLMGLLQPTAGRAEVLGRDCHADAVPLKRHIGYLPDEPFLYPHLSGLELLVFVGGLHGLQRRAARARAEALCQRFGLGEDARAYTATYSHGTRKRLALAAALVHDPRVLVMDEPTNGLDPRAARDMRDTLTGLAAEGRTIFLSTHLLDVADRLCHRVAIVKAGSLRAVGAPGELRTRFGVPADATLEDLFFRITDT